MKAAALLLAMLGGAGCQPPQVADTGDIATPSADPSRQESVQVALLVPAGSSQPGDALLAESITNAARMAVDDLEGVLVNLRVYETGGEVAKAQQAALAALGDGAEIILGPVYAEAANAVGRVVAPHDVNVLSFSNNTTIAGGNVFVLGATFANAADRMVAYAARRGRDRIVVVHADTVSGYLGRQAIETAIQRAGATLAGHVPYAFSAQGVEDAIPLIRDLVQTEGANTLFLTASTSGALPRFSQLLPEAGLPPEAVQYLGLTQWNIPEQTLELPGLQGGWFPLPSPARTAQFLERYQEIYGGQPHAIGILAYDGMAAIGALAKSGQRAFDVADLTRSEGFVGGSGIFRLHAHGSNERGLAIATIRNNQLRVIDPAPRRFGGFGL